MAVGWQQILIILIIALLLFGGGSRITNLMGDFAKGIKAFKKGLAEDDKKVEDKSANSASDAPDAKSAAKSE